MTGSITSTETESVINILPTDKNLGLDSFTSECYQTCKEESIPIFLKKNLIQKIEEEGTRPNQGLQYLDTKTRQGCHRTRKLQTKIRD